MARTLGVIKVHDAAGETISLQKWLYTTLYQAHLPEYWASFAWALSYVLIWLGVLIVLDRKRIYLKI